MITTSDTFMAISGDKTRFAGASVYCIPTILDDTDQVLVDMRIINDSALVDTEILANVQLEFSNSEINAFTSSGTTDRDKFYNQVEQAVVDYLETLNVSATFTIV